MMANEWASDLSIKNKSYWGVTALKVVPCGRQIVSSISAFACSIQIMLPVSHSLKLILNVIHKWPSTEISWPNILSYEYQQSNKMNEADSIDCLPDLITHIRCAGLSRRVEIRRCSPCVTLRSNVTRPPFTYRIHRIASDWIRNSLVEEYAFNPSM